MSGGKINCTSGKMSALVFLTIEANILVTYYVIASVEQFPFTTFVCLLVLTGSGGWGGGCVLEAEQPLTF